MEQKKNKGSNFRAALEARRTGSTISHHPIGREAAYLLNVPISKGGQRDVLGNTTAFVKKTTV
jgi:hypothetical protein